MKRISAKQGVMIFYAFDAFLILILIFCFLPFNKKNKISSMNTALLNPNYVNDVQQIKLSYPDKASEYPEAKTDLQLFKRGKLWFGIEESSGIAKPYIWPADTSNVISLLEEASKVQKVFLASTKPSSWKDFELDKNASYEVSFSDKDGAILSSLFFGKQNGLSGRLYFRTWESSDVYECSSDISSFFNVNAPVSFWSDPFIYPQCVTGYSRQKSESILRHGSIENIAPSKRLSPDFVYAKDFENGSSAKLSIYKKDNAFIVIPVFIPGLALSEEEKDAIRNINYRYSISSLTLEKLQKEFEGNE